MNDSEKFSTPRPEIDREEGIARVLELGRELYESEVVLKWPGIKPDSYRLLKKEEEEFPGFTTPVDELIERFEQEGVTVVIDPTGRNQEVFIVPSRSADVQMDSLFPRHLLVADYMDGKLAELVTLSTALKK